MRASLVFRHHPEREESLLHNLKPRLWMLLVLLPLLFPAAPPVAVAQQSRPATEPAQAETYLPLVFRQNRLLSVTAISVGEAHSCALLARGGLQCWGRNTAGRLGDGTTINRLTPVDVVGLTANVQAVSAGEDHSCALTTAGGVFCWGYNGFGQLGDGTQTDRWIAVDASGLAIGTTAVDAGDNHTCALAQTGAVLCWGDNKNGQLGDGTRLDHFAPAPVSGLTEKIVAITSGDAHSCALAASGRVLCWGDNENGQLGNGTTSDSPLPVEVAGLTGVRAINAGEHHTCALTPGGAVFCWGRNLNGQVGDNSTADRLTPTQVVGMSSDGRAVNGGEYHTCALTTAGAALCWGFNNSGQLGDGTHLDRWVPVGVSGLASGVDDIRAGWFHSCALTSEGGVKCWGRNNDGRLGDGTTTNRNTPVDVVRS